MDHEAFDRLTKLLSRAASRRAALAAGGAALPGQMPFLAAAKGKRKDKGKRHVKSQARAKGKAQPTPCYPGTSCIPGKGKNTSGCDFSGSTVFFRGDFRGSNLSNSAFTGAKLAQGDFRGANLSGACFVDTTLLAAKLGASVNLDKAIFCRTRMPDGSIDDSGCTKGTACCPTCIKAGNTCGAGIAGACCAGTDCCNGRCQAGCCPATCESLGKACGAWPDGCGGTLQCGSCGTGATPNCDDGICATCAATCGSGCGNCANLVDGSTHCGSGVAGSCELACASHADCPALAPFCLASFTDRLTNTTTTVASLCEEPSLAAACAVIGPC